MVAAGTFDMLGSFELIKDVVLDVGCEGCYFLTHASIWE